MAKNYRQLTESINSRLNPDSLILEKAFSDELGTISYNDTLVFIRTAMKGVDANYTQKSRDAGERVKDHLNSLADKTFKYQGSVMTNTHIKGVSDIDLLVISDKFYSYDTKSISAILESTERKSKFYSTSIQKLENEKATSNYSGNSIDDLKKLRLDSETSMKMVYSICDTSKPKAIKIKNLNLNREVDIVVANWYDDVSSIINDKGDYRGVQVYDKSSNTKGSADYPFLNIRRINERSSNTNGRLKKMIRFLKNLKAFSQVEIDLSSFDINAICYDIDSGKYQNQVFHELVGTLIIQLRSLSTNSTHSDDLVSVDSREYIFRFNNQKLENMRLLLNEVESVFSDLQKVTMYG